MHVSRYARGAIAALCLAAATGVGPHAQQPQPPRPSVEPQIGQKGKDVIWVPTPPELLEKMLDLAQVTPRDFVVDLGSGDGRAVIAAAKRGAQALGVEYDANLVEVSKRNAAAAGVADKATFIRGDMYKSDFSRASVLVLFLLPTNLARLRPGFLNLAPGTRIVVNNFEIPGWHFDDTVSLDICDPWCTAKLWVVPAKVAGAWRMPRGTLTLTQSFQQIGGTLATGADSTPIANATLRGAEIAFTSGTTEYAGRVHGNVIDGTMSSDGRQEKWRATRTR
jgi:SAM-dependent methyltransferase